MFKKKFPSLSSLGSDGNTAFLRAARAGNLEKVLEHLKNNIDINTSNSNGLNALHLASKDGHVAVVTELLKRGASVDAATKKGNTALHIASLAGQEEVVKLLVTNGAAVNVQSQNGFTPLYMAAQENHDNVVRYLLANGANQSLATEDGFTPLAVAMQQGHDKVVAVLLENDTRGKVRLPALHIAAKKDDCKAAALLLQNDHNPDVTSKSGFTPLHIAAHYGNENIANLLLSRGADVNYSAKHNITPLHVAAKWGKTNMVSLLLGKGANIESKTRDGLTPLHCAARSGHEQVVDMMLERGAPISSKTKNGLAPLHMASQGDHVDAARILLYHRAPVDEVTVDYLTALHVAAHCGHVRVAKLLLDRKADPNARALNGFTPLHIACKKNRIKVVELLLKHGASIEATTESGLTPLHVASFMGCMNIVIYLLQHDANPDVPTVRGETPLHLAARANQTDIIRILLRNGAQVDARAREQQTPLHIASRLGNVDIVMLLLQHGAAVDSTTKDMYTALHIAGKEGQEEVASVLLEHGASLTATTKKGFTPLHLAAKYGNMKVAKLLLQRDAPVDAQGKNGVTPLHVASHYDHQNVALLLLDKGASPHATAKNGHTPLHIAARKNQMDIATTLLEYGAKANAESKAGFTPLHLSSQEGHTDMSTLLIEHQADTNHKAKNGLAPLHLCAQEDRVNVAAILLKNGAEVDTTTKAGYTPLHVASHFGQSNMVRFLLQHKANVAAVTSIGYTPLHQAAQQGHAPIVNILLDHKAPPNMLTSQGQTALSIAQKLGYISVVESLKVVTETVIPTNATTMLTEEKYRVVAPETMQETFMSDSEDEGGEDTMLSDQPYRYLTVDEMKSLGDDSLPIDVTRDERIDSNRECMAPPTAVDDTISPQHAKETYTSFVTNFAPDNVDINRHPVHVGKLHWKNFLVSFLVDARGGAMRGCRHSGVRVIVPPRRAAMPTRVTCRYLKRDKLTHPPPLMEGEALASRILELGPVGAKFLGPVIIEVPHFGSLRGMEREIVILRSDNGETWREHTTDASEEAIHEAINESFEGEELNALEDSSSGRTTRILTNDFPQYFAVVSRIRQEVHAIGPEGGMVSSSVVPQVQAVFPQGALTKKIKVGLQAQPIAAELTAKLLGNRVAVSPIVTVEPRRRKFHKPITLTIPVPQAANKGMINQYSGDAPTLRLLCSITGGTTRAQWEDVTGSTPLTFVNDCVSFTTTVSARFWLMDCRNIGEATKMATELYKEAIHVPFMAKFVVFAKRVDVLEARLRVFCMTDDKEDKTLEHQEHFTEVAKSRDVEVLEGKPQYIEFAGNLVPVTKSGDQLQLGFRAFRENRLPFTVRVKDPHADTVGRILFMREPKVAKGEPPQQPVCILNIVLPETILPESGLSEPDLVSLQKKYSFLRDGGFGRINAFQHMNLRLSDISNLLAEDWVILANELGVSTSDVNIIKTEFPSSVAQQAMAMLRLWVQQSGNKATANTLEKALRKIGRDDIIQQCIFNVDEMDEAVEKVRQDQSGFDLLKEELGPSRNASLHRETAMDITAYDEQDLMKESESVEELVQAEKKKSHEDFHIQKTDVILKDWPLKEKDDVDESEERKYIGEEKVVEEERRTVAQLKEIFAQDKRDRQYERQPIIISDEEAMKRHTSVVTESDSPIPPSKTDDDTSRLSTSTFEDSTMEDEMSQKQVSSPEQFPEEAVPIKVTLKEDQRRDSELFQGVSEGLVKLDDSYKVIPTGEEILSPKVSKTPPPSPAEFKEQTGTAIWQESPLLTAEQQPPAQDKRDVPQGIKQEQDKPAEGSRLLKQTVDHQQAVETLLIMHPEPSPRHTPASVQDVPTIPITNLLSSSLSVTTDSEQPVTEKQPDQIIEDVQSYSERKKFWEQMTTGHTKSSGTQDTKQESGPLPIPKPRSIMLPSQSTTDAALMEMCVKSEYKSDSETTFSESTVLMDQIKRDSEPLQFTSSDSADREGSVKEVLDAIISQPSIDIPTVIPEDDDGEEDGVMKPLASERYSKVIDDKHEQQTEIVKSKISKQRHSISEDKVFQKGTHATAEIGPLTEVGVKILPVRKTIYERSVSLPTTDITPFDHSSSVQAKKRYFEAHIKKEMVVEQLMKQPEEESSPEHKSIHHSPDITEQQADHEVFAEKSFLPDIKSEVPEVEATVKELDDKRVEYEDLSALKDTVHTDVQWDIAETATSSYKKGVKDIRSVFESKDAHKDKELEKTRHIISQKFETDLTETQQEMSTDTSEVFQEIYSPEVPVGIRDLTSDQKEQSEAILDSDIDQGFKIDEVLQYKTESISKPSDSLEVHVDKSETEETEKDIEEEIKEMEIQEGKIPTQDEYKSSPIIEDEPIPLIRVTYSGKQRIDSDSPGESEDTASESDVTPEEARGEEHALYQPEEHIHDTVWEVPVQEEPQIMQEEVIQEISLSKEIPIASTHSEEYKHIRDSAPCLITKEQARILAEEIIYSIEEEVAKRDDLCFQSETSTSPPVPPPEIAETQVTEYLRHLSGKDQLEPREVQLVESVLARKHREQIKKFSRTDTTSSIEITDEDLRSSGVDTDLSPVEGQLGKYITVSKEEMLRDSTTSDRTLDDHFEPSIDLAKLEAAEAVEKTLAEVRESLEAAQEELIEEHKKKEDLMQKKKSPSEFEFKMLTFENKFDEQIEESYSEQVSASIDYMEAKEDGSMKMQATDIELTESYELKSDAEKIQKQKTTIAKDGTEKQEKTVTESSDIRDIRTVESTIEDISIDKTDDSNLLVGKKLSASFLDEEAQKLSSETKETELKSKKDLFTSKTVKESEKTDKVSKDRVDIISQREEETDGVLMRERDEEKFQKISVVKKEKDHKLEEHIESLSEAKCKTVTTEEQSTSHVIQEYVFEAASSSQSFQTDMQSDEDKDSRSEDPHMKRKTSQSEAIFADVSGLQKPSVEFDLHSENHEVCDSELKTGIAVSECGTTEAIQAEHVTELHPELSKLVTHDHTECRYSERLEQSLTQDEPAKLATEVPFSKEQDYSTEQSDVETPVVMRRHQHDSSDPAESITGVTLRADRRSGADFEAWSSSGESHYQSFEQTSESGRSYSRPCSSDVEVLVAGVGSGTTGSSEYESALTSAEYSARSTATSHEYHTAVSSLSSRESMKSLDSESSGHLASIEVSSEASETLVPSALELERDMDGMVGSVVMDEDDHRDMDFTTEMDEPKLTQSCHPITASHISNVEVSDTKYDMSGKETGSDKFHIDSRQTEGEEYGRISPFEVISESDILDYTGQIFMPEEEVRDQTLGSVSDDGERHHCMKRSHEMIFQPEPRPVITDSPLSETGTEIQDDRLGSSVEESSMLSTSSTSDASALRTVIEVLRADTDKMEVSVASEPTIMSVSQVSELSLEDADTIVDASQPYVTDSGTCTHPPPSSEQDLQLSSVTITTSSVDEYGIQSVCTQVTSQSQSPVLDESCDHIAMEDTGVHERNGPTQVDYIPEYDDFEDVSKRGLGHRRKESTSGFALSSVVSDIKYEKARSPETTTSKTAMYSFDDMAESDKYKDSGPLTLKEVSSDEKKDIDESERSEEESYQTEADQGFHRDLKEGRILLEDVSSIDEDTEIEFRELDSSRPQSQVSKSDSDGHRPVSSGFSDDRPDSELAELLKQCSSDGKEFEDPVERPLSPEPAEECELKGDTPEFSSEAQASVTELEMEYSGAFSRVTEYASQVSPVPEEHMPYDVVSEEETADAGIVIQRDPQVFPTIQCVQPGVNIGNLAAEKHETETGGRPLKERRHHTRDITVSSPTAIPNITVTQHMTPLVDRDFHYPDLESEELARTLPQTPVSISSQASSETETDQGREYVVNEERAPDYISEESEQDENVEDRVHESRSADEGSGAEEKTVYETERKVVSKSDVGSPATESPASDSFEMLEKPDLTDEYVVVEEVGKEAEEHDTEGKSVRIQKAMQTAKAHSHKTCDDDTVVVSPPAPTTKMTQLKYYPEAGAGEDVGPFPFEDSPPTGGASKKPETSQEQNGAKAGSYESEESGYENEVEANKKWMEMQFQTETASSSSSSYGYEMEFERAPLEDIKEEEVSEFDQSSSKVGSIGSYQASTIGSFGSMKESLSSTPEYDVLAGRKFFSRSGEHDDVSMSSLQEFEQLEHQLALEAARKKSHGSQDSLNGSLSKRFSATRSGQGDDISLSSLKEFEGLESACIEAAKIESRAKEEEESLLSEIEEGHESQVSESESCETMSVGEGKIGGESVDSDDYEKRMFEIDEIIRQAQSNVEKFVEKRDKTCGEDQTESSVLERTESVDHGDSLEEVAHVPELDLDQPTSAQLTLLESPRRSTCDITDSMKSSTDSLDLRTVEHQDSLRASMDSLDLKTVAEKSGDPMTASTDSIEMQAQKGCVTQGDIMTDSIELLADTMVTATSTDSLDILEMAAVPPGSTMSDSVEEEEETSVQGQGGQGSGSGAHDQSSSSGREGDLSSSGKEDNSGDQCGTTPAGGDLMLGSTDSLEPSSSTATHATYQYETDSVMSSSFTSGGSNTMVSSTDTLDPTATITSGINTIDLVSAAAHSGLWFEEGSSSKSFITEGSEPESEGKVSLTMQQIVSLPPEVKKMPMHAPDVQSALKEYVEQYVLEAAVSKLQGTDSEAASDIKPTFGQLSDLSHDGAQMVFTASEFSERSSQMKDKKKSESGQVAEPVSGTGLASLQFHSLPSGLLTQHTSVTHHVVPSTHGAVVVTQQGKSTPHLTDLPSGEQQQDPLSSHEATVRDEQGEESLAQSRTSQGEHPSMEMQDAGDRTSPPTISSSAPEVDKKDSTGDKRTQ